MCFRPPSVKKTQTICTVCRKLNQPDAKVCEFCGAELKALAIDSSEGDAQLPPDAPLPAKPSAGPPAPKAPPPLPNQPPKPPRPPGG